MKRLSYTIVLAVYTFTSAAFGGLEYKREPLPDEENAWTYWNNALEYLSQIFTKDIKQMHFRHGKIEILT